VKSPALPPPLRALEAHRQALEVARLASFEEVKAALEAEDGNIVRAAMRVYPDLDRKTARNRVNKQVRRLGLAAYAAALRVKSTGSSVGRPRSGGREPRLPPRRRLHLVP